MGRDRPLPTRAWSIAMRWHDLLFMHWPVDADRLREFVPPGLEIETFGGAAWLGVVPFWMSGIRHRLAPSLPGLSRFPELNVRTYVRAGDRPGVWFFSLDATSRIAVRVARATFGLAYMDATIDCRAAGAAIHYRSERSDRRRARAFGHARSRRAALDVCYEHEGEARLSSPGTIEWFLTERYCLYAWRRGRLVRGDIDHGPWRLHAARADARLNTMAEPIGIRLRAATLLHLATRMDVRAWLPERVG